MPSYPRTTCILYADYPLCSLFKTSNYSAPTVYTAKQPSASCTMESTTLINPSTVSLMPGLYPLISFRIPQPARLDKADLDTLTRRVSWIRFCTFRNWDMFRTTVPLDSDHCRSFRDCREGIWFINRRSEWVDPLFPESHISLCRER